MFIATVQSTEGCVVGIAGPLAHVPPSAATGLTSPVRHRLAPPRGPIDRFVALRPVDSRVSAKDGNGAALGISLQNCINAPGSRRRSISDRSLLSGSAICLWGPDGKARVSRWPLGGVWQIR